MPLTSGTETVGRAVVVEESFAVESDAATWLKVEPDGDVWRTKIVPLSVFCAKTTDFRRVLSDRMYVTPGLAA